MKISFTQYQKGIQQTELPVIKDLSVTIHAGEMVAVVGSSGSGKSLLAHGIMGILPYNAEMGGEIRYCGEPLTEKTSGNCGERNRSGPAEYFLSGSINEGRTADLQRKKNKEKKKHLDSIFEQYSLDKRFRNSIRLNFPGNDQENHDLYSIDRESKAGHRG